MKTFTIFCILNIDTFLGGNCMFGKEYDALSNAATGKSQLLKKNPFGYLLLSALAGMFIGFGNLLINVEGGY